MRIAIAMGALVVGTSAVTDRLNGPERIRQRGNVVHVRTYDQVVLARLRGGA